MQNHAPSFKAWRTYRRLLGYSAAYWKVASLAIVGMVVDAACTTLFAKLISLCSIDCLSTRTRSRSSGCRCGSLASSPCEGSRPCSDYGMAYVGRNVVQTIRTEVFHAYLRLPAGFFSAEANGAQIARITYTCEQVAQASTDAVKTALIDGLTVIGLAGVMIYYSPFLAIALLLMMPLVAAIATAVSRIYRPRRATRPADHGDGHWRRRRSGQWPTRSTVVRRPAVRSAALSRHHESHSTTQSESGRRGCAFVILGATGRCVGAGVYYFSRHPTSLARVDVARHLLRGVDGHGWHPAVLKRLTSVQSNIQRGMVAAEDLFAVLDMPSEADHGSLATPRVRGE
ncbi:ABC transporter transmembrane domain-containing protein [Rhodanobacter lindaniclasticus]